MDQKVPVNLWPEMHRFPATAPESLISNEYQSKDQQIRACVCYKLCAVVKRRHHVCEGPGSIPANGCDFFLPLPDSN